MRSQAWMGCSSAAMHEPTATDQVVNQGDSADPRNSLTGDLPEGTNLSWEQPVDTSTSDARLTWYR
mgnify:CR=1 FL=1